MRHNRVLGLAIASALAIGANLSYAGKLEISYVDQPCGGGIKKGPATLASEIFFSNNPVVFGEFPCGTEGKDDLENKDTTSTPPVPFGGPAADETYNDVYFYATYTFTTGTNDVEPFLAKFTLGNGATFGEDISLADGTNLDFVAHPSGTHAGATLNSGGKAGDTEVTFYIMPDKNNKIFILDKDTLVLRFSMKDLGILKDPGQIPMTANVYPSPNDTTPFDGGEVSATVATSARSSNFSITSSTGIVEIDVAQENTMFVGGGSGNAFIDSTKVKLGNIAITANTGTLDENGKSWDFASNPNTSGTLTITNGVFSASSTEPGRVFLDCGTDANKYDDQDILATVSTDGKTATWDLDNKGLKAIYDKSPNGCNIVLEADGTSTLIQLSETAQATLKINYGGGISDPFDPVDLIYIKRNGVACSIYNVPSDKAIDSANIRITNTSGNDATVYGTLVTKDGDKLFESEPLTQDPISPNATAYISQGRLSELVAAGGKAGLYKGRLVLRINSNVKSLEIFGLVRNKGGGPLTNMSVAATGNGCD